MKYDAFCSESSSSAIAELIHNNFENAQCLIDNKINNQHLGLDMLLCNLLLQGRNDAAKYVIENNIVPFTPFFGQVCSNYISSETEISSYGESITTADLILA